MNVASLPVCKELYTLSEWRETRDFYDGDRLLNDEYEFIASENHIPAYALGYVLRRLPPYINDAYYGKGWLLLSCEIQGKWLSAYEFLDSGKYAHASDADTPEDATAKLAIELFKSGVLK